MRSTDFSVLRALLNRGKGVIMNRRLLKWGAVTIVALGFLAGCSTTKKIETIATPSWFPTPPQDEKYFYGVATATSKDLQLALDKASTDARAEIGRQVELRAQGLQKKFDEETGMGSDAQLLQMYTQASKLVVSTSLSGSKIKEQKFQQEGGVYRAFALVEYPVGVANQDLLNQIKNREEMYTRFRASETFKEMDNDVKRFEEWKKQQAQ